MLDQTDKQTITEIISQTTVHTQLLLAQSMQVAPACLTLFHQVMCCSQHISPHDVQAWLAGLPHE